MFLSEIPGMDLKEERKVSRKAFARPPRGKERVIRS
jgi:hypothetical protein